MNRLQAILQAGGLESIMVDTTQSRYLDIYCRSQPRTEEQIQRANSTDGESEVEESD